MVARPARTQMQENENGNAFRIVELNNKRSVGIVAAVDTMLLNILRFLPLSFNFSASNRT